MTRPTRYGLVLLLAAVLVNLPLVHSTLIADERPAGSDLSTLLVVTLAADVALAVAAILLTRHGGPRRPQLRAIAVGDVERCPPGVALDRVEGETYLIRGEVVDIAADRVVIELGDRSVLVLLDGHANPVGHQQAAQVRARLV
ncbi:hypothetical protein [Nocardioides sp. YIM 152315]|uniref:hypothetical protein n=1 Tax=Nocardioides sp. YIM 152315 TaxID=3031760 RepID=UPI0023DBD0FC|nr:hypothetical protein [Nocardioides sp. YIM 152315]MDF1604548.1 hypothetical protein [Nocardioides sp. YIM 152315]